MSRVAAVVLMGVLMVAPGCRHDDTLTVSVAASLQEAAACVDAPSYRLNVGGSAHLAQQILQGAPVDLFLSASLDELNTLYDEGRLQGEPVPIALNHLIVAMPRDREPPARWQDLDDPRFTRIGIADPTLAPAGRYAVQILRASGQYETLKSRLIPAADVVHARTLLRMGEVDIAIIYATDLPPDDPQLVAVDLPVVDLPSVVFGAGVLREGNTDAAHAWLDRLLSPEGRACLGKLGFENVR